jgi:hypothetical protein
LLHESHFSEKQAISNLSCTEALFLEGFLNAKQVQSNSPCEKQAISNLSSCTEALFLEGFLNAKQVHSNLPCEKKAISNLFCRQAAHSTYLAGKNHATFLLETGHTKLILL